MTRDGDESPLWVCVHSMFFFFFLAALIGSRLKISQLFKKRAGVVNVASFQRTNHVLDGVGVCHRGNQENGGVAES